MARWHGRATSLVLAHSPTTATTARPHALRVNFSNSQVVEAGHRAEGGGQGAGKLVLPDITVQGEAK